MIDSILIFVARMFLVVALYSNKAARLILDCVDEESNGM